MFYFDRGLSTALTVENPEGEGAGGFSFQALLHTYIRLPDGDSIQNLRVRGFYSHSYIDKLLPASAGWKDRIPGGSDIDSLTITITIYIRFTV